MCTASQPPGKRYRDHGSSLAQLADPLEGGCDGLSCVGGEASRVPGGDGILSRYLNLSVLPRGIYL